MNEISLKNIIRLGITLLLLFTISIGFGYYYFPIEVSQLLTTYAEKIRTLYLNSNVIWLFPLITVSIMTVELILLGWEKSSLKRLVIAPSKNEVNDWFFYTMHWLRINFFLGVLLSFGLVNVIPNFVKANLGYNWIASFENIYFQYFIYFLVLDFTNWLIHYARHHFAAYWELHKVHHSATEFNIITVKRVHPIDNIISAFLGSLPIAFLGAPIHYFILFAIFRRGFAQLQHSNFHSDWGWLGYILMSPAHHAIHHSTEEAHHDKNFGFILCIWDQIFGTYHVPSIERPQLGLANESFNKSNPLNEIWMPLVNCWKVLTRK